MNKFFPSYQLYIEAQDGEIIKLPEDYATDREFACKFVVSQTTTSTPQNATINIYNLSDTNRKRLFFNWFDQVAVNKKVELYAGYNEEKHLIFSGVQQEVSSYREGASLVTEIHGTALGFAINGYSINKEADMGYNVTKSRTGELIFTETESDTDQYIGRFEFEAGKSNPEILGTLLSEFTDLQEAHGIEPDIECIIDDPVWENKVYNKPITLVGNIIDLIKEYVPDNVNVWMDNNKLYIVSTHLSLCKEKKRISSGVETALAVSSQPVSNLDGIIVINPDTGLINTPRFYGQSMTLTTLFEPRVKCGMLVRIESVIQPEFNRDYKVCGVTHNCEMGFGTAGSNITTLTLVFPNSNFVDVGYIQ